MAEVCTAFWTMLFYCMASAPAVRPLVSNLLHPYAVLQNQFCRALVCVCAPLQVELLGTQQSVAPLLRRPRKLSSGTSSRMPSKHNATKPCRAVAISPRSIGRRLCVGAGLGLHDHWRVRAKDGAS